jgi:ABC-type glutathione transport system ATPase component
VQSLAGGLRLPRTEALTDLATATSEHRRVGLVGPSGVGKTALACA